MCVCEVFLVLTLVQMPFYSKIGLANYFQSHQIMSEVGG